jgi:glutamine synthetase
MTIIPLGQHREANTDVRKLAAIRERIEAAGVEYPCYQGVTQLHRTAAADLQATREGKLLGGGVEAAEFTMMPDLDTFAYRQVCRQVGREMHSEATP